MVMIKNATLNYQRVMANVRFTHGDTPSPGLRLMNFLDNILYIYILLLYYYIWTWDDCKWPPNSVGEEMMAACWIWPQKMGSTNSIGLLSMENSNGIVMLNTLDMSCKPWLGNPHHQCGWLSSKSCLIPGGFGCSQVIEAIYKRPFLARVSRGFLVSGGMSSRFFLMPLWMIERWLNITHRVRMYAIYIYIVIYGNIYHQQIPQFC